MHYFRIRELMARWEREHGQRMYLKDVATRSGISQTVVTRMANPGGYVTSSKHIEALCRLFGVGPEELISFRPPIDPAGQEQVDIDGLD